MIYLFKVDYYSDTEEDHKLTLLKIGYSSKVFDRLKNHLTSQPRLEVLGWKEGTKEHEAELHNKFSKFRYRNTREWYRYDDEIVKEFMDGSLKERETLNTTFDRLFGLCRIGSKALDILRHVEGKSIELNLQDEFRESKQYILSHIINFSNELYSYEYLNLINPILRLFPDTLVDDGETEYEVEYTRLGPKIIKDNLNITLTKDSVIKDILDLSKDDIYYTIITDNIVDIIEDYSLSPDQVNILCEDTKDNEAVIKKLNYESTGLGRGFEIGRVPLKGEPRKLVTLCTKAIYLGADFYSDNIRSIVVFDKYIDSIVVDSSTGLPQIPDRERMFEKPWESRVELYIKYTTPESMVSLEQFQRIREIEMSRTDKLIASLDISEEAKSYLAVKFKLDVKSTDLDDCVVVNNQKGKRAAVKKKLIQVAEERVFDIQQIDYKDRFSMFSQVQKLPYIGRRVVDSRSVDEFFLEYQNQKSVMGKIRLMCEFPFETEQDRIDIFMQLPVKYRNYYNTLGPGRLKSLGYDITKIRRELEDKVKAVSSGGRS